MQDELNFKIPAHWVDVELYRKAKAIVQSVEKNVLKQRVPRAQGVKAYDVYYVLSQTDNIYENIDVRLVNRCCCNTQNPIHSMPLQYTHHFSDRYINVYRTHTLNALAEYTPLR